MTFDEYLNNIPTLHSFDGGKTWNNGGFEAMHLKAFYDLVARAGGNRATILESGAGNSTLTFLQARPQKVISIAPDRALFDRIKRFCSENGIPAGPLRARIDRSEWALPRLARWGTTIDLALIDGCHGWPTVFVDLCYIYTMLRKGGILIIDDIQLHSVKELARFLATDTARFHIVHDLGKSLVFEKMKDERFLTEWNDQPYIVTRTEAYANPFALSLPY